MKKISQEELDNLLDNHELWLKNPSSDKNRLILRNYDLSFLKIKNRDLSKSIFNNCNIVSMVIKNCDLSEGLFINCTLTNVRLANTNLAKAEIRNCKLDNIVANPFTSFYNLQCPEEGSFIGFKKAYINTTPNNKTYFPSLPVIVKLQITEDSLRSSATSRKCRCSKAKVLSISYLDGTECPEGTIAYSQYNSDFIYKIGDILEIKNFDEDRWEECAKGIHFFITREEAVNY